MYLTYPVFIGLEVRLPTLSHINAPAYTYGLWLLVRLASVAQTNRPLNMLSLTAQQLPRDLMRSNSAFKQLANTMKKKKHEMP